MEADFQDPLPYEDFMKILVIEDDKKTADFLLKALKEAGYTTIHASDGRSGLMTAKTETFDLAIIDLMLPLVDEIIRGGVEAGEFVTPYPDATGQLVLQLGNSFSDSIAGLLLVERGSPDTAAILQSLELYRYAIEQVLGAPYGSIVLYQMRQMVDVCTAIYEKHMKDKCTGIS